MIKYIGILALSLMAFAGPVFAAPEIGSPAPAFQTTDIYGNDVNLSDYVGKIVILEWSNHDCPYVKKHYDSGNMQSLQKEMTDKGIVWLTIVSSAKGKQGYTTPEQAKDIMIMSGAVPTARLLDPSGKLGTLYNARTTPHMYVINADGVLAYMGAIDDIPSSKAEDIKNAKNFVKDAIHALEAGKSLDVTQTQPYGCSIKYSMT